MTILVRFLLLSVVATVTAVSLRSEGSNHGAGHQQKQHPKCLSTVFDSTRNIWIPAVAAKRLPPNYTLSLSGTSFMRVPPVPPTAPGRTAEETLRRWELAASFNGGKESSEGRALALAVPRFPEFLEEVVPAVVLASKVFLGLQGAFIERLRKQMLIQDSKSKCQEGILNLDISEEDERVSLEIELFSSAGPENSEIAVEFYRMKGSTRLFNDVVQQGKTFLGEICGTCLVNDEEARARLSKVGRIGLEDLS